MAQSPLFTSSMTTQVTSRMASPSTATSADARAAHLELAESYRSVIESYERLEALRPTPRSVA